MGIHRKSAWNTCPPDLGSSFTVIVIQTSEQGLEKLQMLPMGINEAVSPSSYLHEK